MHSFFKVYIHDVLCILVASTLVLSSMNTVLLLVLVVLLDSLVLYA